MPPVPEKLSEALAARYEFQRELGQGGMATVYLAKDLKHSREVAVKVLRPDLAASIGSDRFLREIEIAARLQHPHILVLIDSGEAAGFLYYVMPYVEGESLRGLMLRQGLLGIQEAMVITKPVADALTYAHRMGVVHRDIKPENILLSQGHPVVTDFGIAKALSTAGQQNLTRTGFPVGTPGYMSPEQAAAQGGLDEKTDVYSLGCVFYELLIGDVPGMWVTDECVELGRFVDATPEHRRRLDRLSGSLEQPLVHALALRLEHRFDSPNEFMEAIESRDPRKYSATRVRDIVKRASENEAERPETVDGALSLGGVQRLGAEVGIPARQVRRALQELDRPDRSPKTSRFLGEVYALAFERVVDGELPESEYPVLVEEIRVTVGNVGVVSTLGKTFAWHWDGGVERSLHVTVHPRGGQTRIRVEERLGNMAGGMFGGLMGGAGGGGGLPLTAVLISKVGVAAALAFGAWGLMMGGTYVLARAIYTSIVRRRREQLSGLADRLAAHAEDVIEEHARRPMLRQ